MDFTFTPIQEALRQEFEYFFSKEEENAPEGWMGGMEAMFATNEGWAYHRSAAEKLAQKGWLCLPWPKQFGGQEHSHIEQLIFNEVRAYYRVPGVDVHGPVAVAAGILEYGSEEIKREWLPRIARGEINWCEGLSEPNAGSDLASLQTRAMEDGDNYVITGQKIWTTGAHRSDHIFIVARTGPEDSRHKGLTYFLSEMNKPGITVSPLKWMNRQHMYNEVFLDGLRVPKRNIVGEVNQGWYVTMGSRNFARARVGSVAEAKRDLEDLVKYCRANHVNGQFLSTNPTVRNKLANAAIEIEAARQWAYYVAWLQSQGQMVAVEAAASKYFGTELNVHLANIAIEIMSLYGPVRETSKWAPLQGRFENLCQTSLGFTIAGGTTEIEKNVIAWQGLKLPRVR